MTKDTSSKPLSFGTKVIIGFHIVSAVAWLFGQTLSIWQHDVVASWGLQTPAEATENAVIQYDRAIAITDTFILIPLHIMAAYGMIHRKYYGVICSWMNFGVSLYWPTIFLSINYTFPAGGVTYPTGDLFSFSVVLMVILFSIWGSWYQCRNKEMLLWAQEDM